MLLLMIILPFLILLIAAFLYERKKGKVNLNKDKQLDHLAHITHQDNNRDAGGPM